MKPSKSKKSAAFLSAFQPEEPQSSLCDRTCSAASESVSVHQEMKMTSRYVDTRLDSGYSDAQLQLHSHVFYELIYCCTGSETEYLIGSERYLLQPGDIIFVPPGISHRPLIPENSSVPFSRYVLWLSQSFMESYANLFPYKFSKNQVHVGMLRTAGTKWEYLVDLFRTGVQEATLQQDGWETAVIGNTMLLLTQIKRATDERSISLMKAESPELLDQITNFIEENYASRFTIGDLAKQLYVSDSTISHLFKQKMGVSFYRYVTQRRLIAAKPLIEAGVLLEEVCTQVGFTDYSGFYRAFKNEYGISPRQYRNLHGIGL